MGDVLQSLLGDDIEVTVKVLAPSRIFTEIGVRKLKIQLTKYSLKIMERYWYGYGERNMERR